MRGFWEKLWYPDMPAERLALTRVFFFAGAFILFLGYDVGRFAGIPEALWFPFSLFRALPTPVLGNGAAVALGWAWKALLIAAACGIGGRFSVLAAAVLSTFVLGLRSGFGFVIHHHCLFLLASWVLALSPCCDRYSLWPRRAKKLEVTEYAWPIRLAQFLLLCAYFSAGIAKLRLSGFSWASGVQLREYLDYARVHYAGSVLHPIQLQWNEYLRAKEALLNFLSASVLSMELLAPLGFFFRPLCIPIVLFFLLFHCAVAAFMMLNWSATVLVFLFFIPFDRIQGFFGSSRQFTQAP